MATACGRDSNAVRTGVLTTVGIVGNTLMPLACAFPEGLFEVQLVRSPHTPSRGQMRSATARRWPTLLPRAAPSSRLTAVAEATRIASVAELLSGPDRIGRLLLLHATSVPPQLFFWLLMLAGAGLPVSEDLLCIYAGAILPQLQAERRVQIVVALYAGVVLSDWLTYLIGRLVGETILKLRTRRANAVGTVAASKDASQGPSRLERAQGLVRRSGRQVGFSLRMAAGLRVPMLLLSGLGRVPFWRAFVPYNLLGALVSLAVQLCLGGLAFRAAPTAAVSGGSMMLLPCLTVAALCALSWCFLKVVRPCGKAKR